LKQPKNIAIIVPTIALTDETRRRLQRKFSNQYKIITTSEVELSEKNIFIFPQERALHYVDKIAELDMLVIGAIIAKFLPLIKSFKTEDCSLCKVLVLWPPILTLKAS
jgi:primosomal protein N'